MAKALTEDQPQSPSGTSFAPETTTQTDHGHGHPHIPVEPPFLYIFVPQRWHICGGRLVPRVVKLPLVRGVQKVDQDKEGRWHLARLRATLQEEGRMEIPWSWAPDGKSYVARTETFHRGQVVTTHISCFDTCHAGDSTIYPDEVAFAAWLDGLIQAKRLPACPPHLAHAMLEEHRASLANAEILAEDKPSASRRAKVEQLRQEIAVLEAVVGDKPTTAKIETRPVSLPVADGDLVVAKGRGSKKSPPAEGEAD